MTILIDLVLAESRCLVPLSELSTDCSFNTSRWWGVSSNPCNSDLIRGRGLGRVWLVEMATESSLLTAQTG